MNDSTGSGASSAARVPAALASATPAHAAPALRVERLRKEYGSVTALEEVLFTVRRDQIVGVLAPEGAGKTTTINVILGVLEPSAGLVTIDGIDIAKNRARALARTNF